MKHFRLVSRPAEAAVSPLQAKFDYIADLIDAGIAFVMQKEGSTL